MQPAQQTARQRAFPVISIDTRERKDTNIIDQDRLKIVFEIQMVHFRAANAAMKATECVYRDLREGSKLAPGTYKWDAEFGRVTDGTL